MKEDFKEALGKVIGGIAELAEKERQESSEYQELERAETIVQAVRIAEEKMSSVAMDLTLVLRQKFGIRVTNEGYHFIKRLPYEQGVAEKEVIEEQGHSVDCWPKSIRRLAEKIEAYKRI